MNKTSTLLSATCSALCCLTFLCQPCRVIAAPISFQSSESQTSLLELYTSEGCSSCPPADKWVAGLNTSSNLWKDFVPVAFHVDYWDTLGWKDTWSSKSFSDRQRAYAKAWRSDSIYTPAFVLNGAEWRDWARATTVSSSTRRPGILKAVSNDLKRWDVTFFPVAPVDHGYEVHAALLVSGLVSDVKSGENRGRRLQHDFVALNLSSALLKGNSGTFTGSVPLAGSPMQGRSSLACWVTKIGKSEPLQATGGWLVSRP